MYSDYVSVSVGWCVYSLTLTKNIVNSVLNMTMRKTVRIIEVAARWLMDLVSFLIPRFLR